MTNKTPFTDQQLYEMSVHEAYNIEERRKGEKFTDAITKTTYTVVDIEHDTKTGLDAIALQDENNNIMIVYGGTDTEVGTQDVINDVQIGGTYTGMSSQPVQFEQAKAFRNRVACANPDKSITLTGHSLGGALSNVVALDSGDSAINFNPAPLPYNFHTIYGNGANRNDIINYQTLYDPLRIASIAYGGYLPGQLKVFQAEGGSAQEEHNMVKVKFDSEGYLIDVKGERVFNFTNTNINTENPIIDEAYRGFVMSITGGLMLVAGAISVSRGAMLFFMPGISFLGGVIIVGGIAMASMGLITFLSGFNRGIIAAKTFLLESGKWLLYSIKSVIKMVHAVSTGFLAVGQKILNDLVSVCGVLIGSAGAFFQSSLKLASALVLVAYENVAIMALSIQRIELFIQQKFQECIKSFIDFKDYLFNITYAFIMQSVQALFDVADIIALLGSTALQVMSDILTLNWDKILNHVIEKIYDSQTDAKQDFLSSNRGFNHNLAEEIYHELNLLANNIRVFSEKVLNVSKIFREVETSLSSQIKYIGG